MLGKARVIGFALAMLTSPMALAQSYTNGQTLFTDNACGSCHDFLGAMGLQAIRDQVAQRTTPVPGLNYSKSLMALNAALLGTDLDNDLTGMDAQFPAGTFSAAQIADLATYIANMPNPAPTLTHLPFPVLVFAPTAVGATASQTVTVTNSGTAPLVFATNGAATIASGPFSADFSVSTAQASSFCQGMTLQTNGSCTVAVQFSPQAGSAFARSALLALVTTTTPNTTLVSMLGNLPGAPSPVTPPPATPPVGAQPPTNSANAPSSGGGALPWQVVGLLLLSLIPGIRRRR